jgi:hypothetical protein
VKIILLELRVYGRVPFCSNNVMLFGTYVAITGMIGLFSDSID